MAPPDHDAVTATDEDPRRRPPPALERLLAGISTGERIVGGFVLAVLGLLVLLQTGVRFLPVGGWVWTGELARLCLVWLTFSLAGYLMEREAHITLELVDYFSSGRALWAVRWFANAVVALVCAGFVVESLAMVTEDTGQATPAMELPLGLVYVIPLAGFALTATRAALGIVWQPPAGGPEPAPYGTASAGDRAATSTGGSAP